MRGKRFYRRLIQPGDWVILGAACLIALGSHWFGDSSESRGRLTGARVVVTVDGRALRTWPMPDGASVRTDTLMGAVGPMVIETTGASVRVLESSCRDHWCQREGALTGAYGSLVCLPNRLVVRIDAPRNIAVVDAVTQ